MREWWHGLTGRERMMILIAGGLTAILVVYFLMFVPLRDAHNNAEREYRRMSLEAQQVFQGIAQLESQVAAVPSGVETTNESLELLLSRTATAAGLQIVRLQPSGSNQTTVWFDTANAQTLMLWLTELEGRFGLSVQRAELRKRSENNTLRGSVLLQREGA